jgi:hypothetical protein
MGIVAKRNGDCPLISRWSRGSSDGGAGAPVARQEGNRGVLDGHEPELGGNWALKREPNYD